MPRAKKKLPEEDAVTQEQSQEVEEVEEKEIVEETKIIPTKVFDVSSWQPRSSLGCFVKDGRIKDIDKILDSGTAIMEAEIIDVLLPNMSSDLLLIGQSRGKFGGGQRRVFKQVQKKTAEGNKPKFATVVVIGDNNGHVGVGYGKAKETVPSREKALKAAKLNLIKIKRGCGSWQCGCKEPHSIPYKVEGKCGSVRLTIVPAPKGAGLCIEKECAKILKAAGIRDVWSHTEGQTRTKLNLIYACVAALKKLTEVKTKPEHNEMFGIIEGAPKEDSKKDKNEQGK